MAYTIEDLKKALPKHNVYFKFRKVSDGSIRHALGTTNLKKIPKEFHPKGERGEHPGTVVFFDIQDWQRGGTGWRSLRNENLIDIVYVFPS